MEGKFAEAIAAFHQARELKPKHPHIAGRLAEVERQQQEASAMAVALEREMQARVKYPMSLANKWVWATFGRWQRNVHNPISQPCPDCQRIGAEDVSGMSGWDWMSTAKTESII
jgi:hypothetical protein